MGVVSYSLLYEDTLELVKQVKRTGRGQYYDLHVPVAEYYHAGGLWHHNTGKTTVIKHLLTQHRHEVEGVVGSYATAAFTGKAANVLRRKGVPAQTIHSLIYEPARSPSGRVVFRRKPMIAEGLVIIDEASMVSTSILNDLRHYPIRLLCVGDMGQLEPIGDNPRLMANPNVRLETIHRQASESDIIRYSIGVRNGADPKAFRQSKPHSEVCLGDGQIFDAAMDRADQILCGFNATRHQINRIMRMRRGIDTRDPKDPSSLSQATAPTPQVGDRVICLQNNKNVGVFNGMIGHIARIEDTFAGVLTCDVQEEDGDLLTSVRMKLNQFGADKQDYRENADPELTFWDYGYCVTTHKSQGSEFDHVLVVDQVHREWTASRWRYTAITRAAKGLIYCFTD